MLHTLFVILMTAIAILVVAKLMPGVRVRSFGTAIVVALVFSVLHALLFGLLVFLTLPITIVTFGLFLFVINAFLLWLTNQLVSGFEVRGFFTTVIAAALISFVAALVR